MKTTGAKATKFDRLVAQAVRALEAARQEQNATDLSVRVVRGQRSPDVSLYFEEREIEGVFTGGVVKLGRQ